MLFAVNQPPSPIGVTRYGLGVPLTPRRMSAKTGRLIAGAVILGVCCILPATVTVIGSLTGDHKSAGSDTPRAAPPVVETSAPVQVAETTAAPAPPAGPATSFGPGMYEVGVEIKPGTYTCTADGPISSYWERARDASGEFEAIIANGNIKVGTQGIITVKAKEFFKIDRGRCAIR